MRATVTKVGVHGDRWVWPPRCQNKRIQTVADWRRCTYVVCGCTADGTLGGWVGGSGREHGVAKRGWVIGEAWWSEREGGRTAAAGRRVGSPMALPLGSRQGNRRHRQTDGYQVGNECMALECASAGRQEMGMHQEARGHGAGLLRSAVLQWSKHGTAHLAAEHAQRDVTQCAVRCHPGGLELGTLNVGGGTAHERLAGWLACW